MMYKKNCHREEAIKKAGKENLTSSPPDKNKVWTAQEILKLMDERRKGKNGPQKKQRNRQTN